MDQLDALYKKYLDSAISADELHLFWELVRQQADESPFWEKVAAEYTREDSHASKLHPQKSDAILAKIFSTENVPQKRPFTNRKSWTYLSAAVLTGVLFTAVYWIVFSHKEQSSLAYSTKNLGKGTALLTLSNGQEINIDSLPFHKDWQGAHIQAATKKDVVSEIRFTDNASLPNAYFSLHTKESRNIETTLPDGTKVWLNANSKLRFPASFAANSRELYLSGEGYFEVAKKTDTNGKRLPFVVHVVNDKGSAGTIRVLGTHFNVKDYAEDGTVTCTLLEGSIEYTHADKSILLKPRQQILVNKKIAVKELPQSESVLAWKNGQIFLDQEDAPSIFNEISRWYNVKVKYIGNVPSIKLNGILDKNLPLEDILDVFNSYGLHCVLEGNTIRVSAQYGVQGVK
ncbi:MAG: FecR domain-containing protein [Chitinophagaceae bacterium]